MHSYHFNDCHSQSHLKHSSPPLSFTTLFSATLRGTRSFHFHSSHFHVQLQYSSTTVYRVPYYFEVHRGTPYTVHPRTVLAPFCTSGTVVVVVLLHCRPVPHIVGGVLYSCCCFEVLYTSTGTSTSTVVVLRRTTSNNNKWCVAACSALRTACTTGVD